MRDEIVLWIKNCENQKATPRVTTWQFCMHPLGMSLLLLYHLAHSILIP